MSYKIKSRGEISKGKKFKIFNALIEVNGQVEEWEYVQLGNIHKSVMILPVDDKKNIWVIKKYMVGIDAEEWVFPGGKVEEGESEESAAKRELREELGVEVGRIEKLGRFNPLPSYVMVETFGFIASGVKNINTKIDEDEVLGVDRINFQDFHKWIKEGKITDSRTIAIFFRAATSFPELNLNLQT